MLQAYPQVDTSLINTTVDADIEWVKGVIIGIRNIRGEMNIPPGKTFPALLRKTGAEDQRRLHENLQNLLKLAKLSELRCLADDETAPVSATQLYQDMEILVPLSDLIDKNAEITRLEKEIAKLDKNLQGINGKLSNEKFVSNAKADVIAAEQKKKEDAENWKPKQNFQRIRIRMKSGLKSVSCKASDPDKIGNMFCRIN
jgi:valyl-tRNA synthetase